VKSAALVSKNKAVLQREFASLQANMAESPEPSVVRQVFTPLPSINFEPETLDRSRAETVKSWPAETISGIEAMPHLANRITRLWKTRDLNTLIHNVLLDSRDGDRKGFPREIAQELMFLAKLNTIVRANDAAPMLGMTVGEACKLIEKGDHAAIAHGKPAMDHWGNHDRSSRLPAPLKNSPPIPASGYHHAQGGRHERVVRRMFPELLSPSLRECPPIPSSVCLDLTAPKTLRHGKDIGHHDDGDLMEQGFFRCIAKELGTLKIPQLILSDLGNVQRCSWLPSAVSFAKNRCHFQKVVLQIDPLSALEPLLVLAMAAGLDHLVINYNLASGKWRTRAMTLADSDPEYFKKQIQRLVESRDQITAKTGHHCVISVNQINHKSVFHLSQTFVQLSHEAGLEPYRHLVEGKRGENVGDCHCWSPFIEAHIRTNGHLVACAQDHSGYSFTANLKETTFTDAWNGQVFQKTRQRVLHGEKPGRLCEICPHKAEKAIAPDTKPA